MICGVVGSADGNVLRYILAVDRLYDRLPVVTGPLVQEGRGRQWTRIDRSSS